MLCEKCGKNNATTHIRTVVNGVVSEKYLCGYCAANENYSDIKGNNLSQMLSSMFGDASNTSLNTHIFRCKCCGSTFSDIARSGKCGCPECYTTFYEQLLPYLKRVHGSTQHIGKSPVKADTSKTQSNDSVKELRELLAQLVQEEKYEQAALIRDKIKRIESEKQ